MSEDGTNRPRRSNRLVPEEDRFVFCECGSTIPAVAGICDECYRRRSADTGNDQGGER